TPGLYNAIVALYQLSYSPGNPPAARSRRSASSAERRSPDEKRARSMTGVRAAVNCSRAGRAPILWGSRGGAIPPAGESLEGERLRRRGDRRALAKRVGVEVE